MRPQLTSSLRPSNNKVIPVRKQLISSLLSSPIAALSAAIIATGGLQLLIFFSGMNFIPDFSVADILPTLYSTAVLGGVLIIYTCVIFAVPPIAVAYTQKNKPLGPHVVVRLNLMSTLVAFFFVAWQLGVLYEKVFFFLMIITLMIAPALLLKMGRAKYECKKEAIKSIFKAYPRMMGVTAFVAAAFIGSIIFFMLTWWLNSGLAWLDPHLALAKIFGLMACIGMSSTLLCDAKMRKQYAAHAAVLGVLLYVMLIFSGSFSAIATVSVRNLGLGEIEAARIVVSTQGCREINAALGKEVCVPAHSVDAPIPICPVGIRSRIGSQVVLDFASIIVGDDGKTLFWQKDKKSWGDDLLVHRVILDKSLVLSWRRLPSIERANPAVVTQEMAEYDGKVISDFCENKGLHMGMPKKGIQE